MTFETPFLRSKYGSGNVHLRYGDETLNLDSR